MTLFTDLLEGYLIHLDRIVNRDAYGNDTDVDVSRSNRRQLHEKAGSHHSMKGDTIQNNGLEIRRKSMC